MWQPIPQSRQEGGGPGWLASWLATALAACARETPHGSVPWARVVPPLHWGSSPLPRGQQPPIAALGLEGGTESDAGCAGLEKGKKKKSRKRRQGCGSGGPACRGDTGVSSGSPPVPPVPPGSQKVSSFVRCPPHMGVSEIK